MKYRDLVQFEPVETIIQLQEADEKAEAAHLVQTYVISDRMADQLINLVFPQLQIDRPADNKGMLIVGNYGTGKSHLMSVISAVAEHADLVDDVRNPAVREAARQVAGRFQVLRTEIGGVETSLRDIVLGNLEGFLAALGVPYSFPPADRITNNKGAIIEAMAGFQTQYPNQGLLLVVDELLDYLRTRRDQALILDLSFLRELGEVVELTPFRLMAGVQETLFDNPRFEFVAESLRRVRDRFEQVRIAREDIAYVVSERLLRKSDEQIARITTHLRSFAPLYPHLAERLDEYARLFPIHPVYIDTFEHVYIAEKRQVLKTFSLAMRMVMDRDLPEAEPGIISYDHYWNQLQEDPALRTMPGVADVVEKSNVLEGRIRNAYTRPQYREMALRIVKALSVQRLTTSDFHAPIGVTAEELRDGLFLWTRLPEADAEFLLSTVQVVLREIMRTVSGQYISYNDGNGQYYLDLKKDIDFDAKIAQRGEVLSENDLNRYFFDALRQLLNLSTSVYVTGYSIWEYELPWAARNVTRPGYLFFGLPNQRSTAQPPRDFYVYVLPPFDKEHGRYQPQGDPSPDEVLFSLEKLDEAFAEIVRAYGGARSLANESPSHRDTYVDKAEEHLRKLMHWLRQNLTGHLHTTHRGVTRPIAQVLAQTRRSASADPEELLRTLAAQQLAGCFEDAYPHYPSFNRLPQPITESARPTSAMDAVRYIARRTRTNLAIGVLEGLELLDEEENIRPLNSPYARHFLDKLQAKADGQVVNQGEVLAAVSAWVGGAVYKDLQFKLEPEWVAVVLAALVYDGQITLNLGGNQSLDAGNVESAAANAIEDLADFRYYGRPKTLPLPVWTLIFDALGLQSSLVREESNRQQATIRLQERVRAELNQVATWQNQIANGLRLWNESLFTDGLQFRGREGGFVESHSRLPTVSLSQTDLLPYLRKTKEFLELLGRYDTPGKLRNLRLSGAEANEYLGYRRHALRTQEVPDAIAQLQPLTSYLGEAAAGLPDDHPWVERSLAAKRELLDEIRALARGEGTVDLHGWLRRLRDLRQAYIEEYTGLHNRSVLGPAGDDRKVRLMRDARVEQLKALAEIAILNNTELNGWINAISGVPTCRDFHEGLLADRPTCPRCGFRPIQTSQQAAEQRLETLAQRLDALHQQWHAALRQNLQSDTARHSIQSMSPQERRVLDAYLDLADPTEAPLPAGLVQAVNQALQGMQTVSLHVDDLVAALKQGGLPCTVEDLVQRFAGYVQGVMRGHDRSNTRLTIDE